MGAGVAEPQARDAGAGLGGERLADLGDGFLAVGGVVADCLDVEETPGGGEAGCPQRGQVLQPSRGWLIVVSVRSALPSLWLS